MRYYSIDLSDHAKPSWVLHEVVRVLPKKPRKEGLAPVIYKFFPSSRLEVTMKERYRDFCCKTCGRFEAQKMFDLGFDDPVTIGFKGDYGHTNDRIFSINDKFLNVLQTTGVKGYEVKPLGSSGWHAVNITLRVNCIETVITSCEPLCSECGRPRESFGLFKAVRDVEVPSVENTFFTTRQYWSSAHFRDRDIFITEDVLNALKASGIKGGYCTRLLTDEELAKQKRKEEAGTPFWKPPGTSVPLNGKPFKK
jgi:hypothetical protein